MQTCVLVVLVATLPCGCAGHRRLGPYRHAAEADRDGDKAYRLNTEAAKLMDSEPDRAEQKLREALTADLYHGPAHNNLGVIFLKQGRLYEAASEFEWAKKLMPGHPDPRMNLALTLERAGRTEDALATYATALEVYPDHIPTIEAMTLLQVRTGKADSRTPHMLEEIAFRGEDQRWRDWARLQVIRQARR